MAKWDEKYIITELKQNITPAPWTPMFTDKEARRLISVDSEVVKDAFNVETAWFWPGEWPKFKGDEGVVKEHSHDYDEVIAYIGTDPADPHNLCGEIELWIDGKQNIIDKSFVAFLPAGIKHCPLTIKRIDKPIFHFIAGMAKSYL